MQLVIGAGVLAIGLATGLELLVIIGIPALLLAGALSMQVGWSYAVVDDHLVVLRHRQVRRRLPLHDFARNATRFGVMRLVFGRRSVWLGLEASDERAAFVDELSRRAAQLRGRVPRVQALAPRDLKAPVSVLRFPERCVACGAAPRERRDIEPSRGVDLVVFEYRESIELPVPVCARHASLRRLGGPLLWLAAVPLTFLLAWLLLVVVEGGVWSGALLIGSFLALLLTGVFVRCFGASLLDGAILGVRSMHLSGDLATVVLRFRDVGLRDEIAEASRQADGVE